MEGVLYYHGCGGVYAFDGSMPQRVSQALGEDEYHGAVAGGADGKYYLSVLDTENQPQLLVYDVRQGLWHREDDLRAVGFAVNGGVLYAMTGAGDILALKGGGTVQEEPVVWRRRPANWDWTPARESIWCDYLCGCGQRRVVPSERREL